MKRTASRIVHIVWLKIGEQLKQRIFWLSQLLSATTILLISRSKAEHILSVRDVKTSEIHCSWHSGFYYCAHTNTHIFHILLEEAYAVADTHIGNKSMRILFWSKEKFHRLVERILLIYSLILLNAKERERVSEYKIWNTYSCVL